MQTLASPLIILNGFLTERKQCRVSFTLRLFKDLELELMVSKPTWNDSFSFLLTDFGMIYTNAFNGFCGGVDLKSADQRFAFG